MSFMLQTHYSIAVEIAAEMQGCEHSSVLSIWSRLEWLSHCKQPLTLYSWVNAANSLQAYLCADLLQLSCRGFISTQVFDSSRYCILHKEEDGQKQKHCCEITQDKRGNDTHIPLESLVEPSLPMMRYCFVSSSWSLHWRLFANSRMESSITATSRSEQIHSAVGVCVNVVSDVIGIYLPNLSTFLTLASYSSKLLFMETLKTSTTYAETHEHPFIERFYCTLIEK